MAEPFLGEIKLFSYSRIPTGWHVCDGSTLNIQQNAALYSLIGVTYGGDARTTFKLPDLRGRVVVGAYGAPTKAPYGLGYADGSNAVALTMANMPLHDHEIQVSSAPGTDGPVTDTIYAQVAHPSPVNLYGPMSNPPVPIDPSTVQSTGAGAAHDNMQPFQALVYCIATSGDYPPRP